MRNILLILLSIAILAAAPGCWFSEDTATSPTSVVPPVDETIDLDSPTGGLTAMNEAPAFGEPEVYEKLAGERSVEDPILNTYEYRNGVRAFGARIYDFRAVWGRLARLVDSTMTDYCPLDWSGSLHFEGGLVAMRSAIAFEREDSLIRVDRSTIRWISHTGPAFDGIRVKLIVPPPRPADSTSEAGPAPYLVLTTPLYSRTFTLEELAALDVLQPVDRCGNGISITSVLVPLGCPHGHLAGEWEKADPDTTESGDVVYGAFRGIWIGERGVAGHLRGFYGVNNAGAHVFFGKYIDLTGAFVGIVRGAYGVDPSCSTDDRQPLGWFAGEWVADGSDVQGRLKGHWIADGETGTGLFHGNWGMNCSKSL